tara:strand:- start:1369 stop:2220 length:852 start_codon:yes stop_codon:yes gene_type:complete
MTKNYKYDLSVLISGIRTHNWEQLLNSLESACTKYTFELVLIGPFEPPESLKNKENVKFIRDYGQPSRCVQRGLIECEGRLLFQTVDDCNFLNNSIDLALDLYDEKCTRKDIVNGRYFEGGDQMPLVYWIAHHHPTLRLPNIHPTWKISLQPIINTEYAKEIGGWDCRYEYCNAGQHDFVFRAQIDGGKIYDSPIEICNADHMPMYSGDHEPIERLWEENDWPLLKSMYGEDAPDRPINIDINNWKNTPEVWTRRFDVNNLPEKYTDIYPNVQVLPRWKRRQL